MGFPFPPARQLGLIGLLLISVVAGGVALAGRRGAGPPDPLVAALDSMRRVSDSLRAERARQDTLYQLVHDTVTRTRVAYHTIRDSFPIYPTTAADTGRAIAGLPTLVHRADDAIAAAERFQLRADSLRAVAVAEADALRRERDGWRTIALKPPARLGGALELLYDPVQQTPALSAETHVRVDGAWSAMARADERFGRPGVESDRRLYLGARYSF